MSKYFRVSVTGENYASLYDISYSLTSSQLSYTFANIADTSPVTQSISMSYFDMTTDGGVEVEVPNGVYKLKIEDQAGFCPDVTSSVIGDFSGSGANDYYLSLGFDEPGDNCGNTYIVSNEVTSDASSIALGLNQTVYDNGQIFQGNDKYYIVNTQTTINPGTGSAGSFYYWEIDNDGVVQTVVQYTCDGPYGGGEL